MIFIQDRKNVNLYHYDGDNQWLTASTIKFVNNWLHDGIIEDQFIMFEDFLSIEFESVNRQIYNSYPPGCVIPVYLYAKIKSLDEISILDLKNFVFFVYTVCAILISIFFYIISCIYNFQLKYVNIILPIILAIIWTFIPFNYYYFRNVYFSDIAIIPISILFLIIELINYKNVNPKFQIFLNLISFILIFIGVFTDYYFLCLAFASFLSRFIFIYIENEKKLLKCLIIVLTRSKDLILGISISLFLFLYQILKIPNGLKIIKEKFNERTNSDIDGTMFMNHELQSKSESIFTFLRINFGNSIPSMLMYLTLVLLIVSLIKIKIAKKNNIITNFLFIISFSCICHSILLYNHTMRHEFSILKFCIFLVFLIFILLSYVINLLVEYQSKSIFVFLLVLFISIIPIFYYLSYWNNKYYLRRTRQINLENEYLANFIKNNTNYNDVIFSPYYEIKTNPPLNLSISQKRVYKIDSLKEIKLYNLSKNSNIIILLNEDSVKYNSEWIFPKNTVIKKYRGWYFYKY